MTASLPSGDLQTAGLLQFAVIVPVMNERGNVVPLFDALTAALGGLRWEVIFVDDGSTDGTIEQIDRLALAHTHVHALKRHGRKGLSSAVIEGAMATAAPIVAVIDGDMQHDETKLRAMYDALSSGEYDMAIGTRYAAGGSTGDWDGARLKGSLWATRLTRLFVKTPVSDPMSGFFAIRRDIIIDLVPKLSAVGFKILLDILVTTRLVRTQPDLRIIEVAYGFRGRHSGESKMSARVVTDLLRFAVDKTVGRVIPTRLILFLMVGSLGLLVHLAVLRLMLTLCSASFVTAQTAAVIVAIAFNFLLNNIITFADRQLRGLNLIRGLLSFYLICATGALANVGVGSLVFANNHSWWVAGIAGSIIGAVWNYAASSLLTWRKV